MMPLAMGIWRLAKLWIEYLIWRTCNLDKLWTAYPVQIPFSLHRCFQENQGFSYVLKLQSSIGNRSRMDMLCLQTTDINRSSVAKLMLGFALSLINSNYVERSPKISLALNATVMQVNRHQVKHCTCTQSSVYLSSIYVQTCRQESTQDIQATDGSICHLGIKSDL